MFALGPLFSPARRDREWVFSSECKIDQANLTDWMAFLTCNSMEEIIQKTSMQKYTNLDNA